MNKQSSSSALKVVFQTTSTINCAVGKYCCAQYSVRVNGRQCATRSLGGFQYKHAESRYAVDDDVTVEALCSNVYRGHVRVTVSLQKCCQKGYGCEALPTRVTTGDVDVSRIEIFEVGKAVKQWPF